MGGASVRPRVHAAGGVLLPANHRLVSETSLLSLIATCSANRPGPELREEEVDVAGGVQLRDEGLDVVQENLQEETTGFTRAFANIQGFVTQVQVGERSSDSDPT